MRIPHLLAAATVLAFVLLTASAAPSAASGVRGDVNCSGEADSQDGLDLLLTFAGNEVVVPEECIPLGQDTVSGVGGDVNCDGEFDTFDLIAALKLLGGFSVHPCFALDMTGFGAAGDEIGPDGGTLHTTGLDGTEFTLEIPEGALIGPEPIRMTPVDSIENLPIPGGLVAAVDLQPSGLEFWKPVILTIDPLLDVAPEDQTPFVISVGEFVLHPLMLESAEIQLPLTHFSAAGLAQGPAAELPPLSNALDRYTAAAAALVNPQRAAVLGGGSGDPQFQAQINALMQDYYETEIAPAIEAADVNAAGLGACPVPMGAIIQMLGLEGQGSSIGGNFAATMAALQRLAPALPGCRQGDFVRCVQNHDLSAISRIVAYSNVLALLGLEPPSPLDEMMEKCARFSVTFNARFCTDQATAACSAGIEYGFATSFVYFSIPLNPTDEPLATAPLELTVGNWHEHVGCHGTMTSPGSTFKVYSPGISLNSFRSGRLPNAPPIELLINPGIPQETLSLTCPGGTDEQHDTLWWRKWCSFHQKEITPPHPFPSGYCLDTEEGEWKFAITRDGWTKLAGAVWDLTIIRDNSSVGVNEIGKESFEMSISHEPLP